MSNSDLVYRLLSDPELELRCDAARLQWLIAAADRHYRSLSSLLDDEDLVADLCRERIDELESVRTILRRRGGLPAATRWLIQPSESLYGATPSEEFEHDVPSVLDAALHDPQDNGTPDDAQLAAVA